MKKTIQIVLLLCFSISLSAQKISCAELMKMPFGKYLYENDGTSLALVLNELENCGVEKYELDMSILQIFISNIVGEKGEAATVQDLYDEILIFRQQNDSKEVKAIYKKRELLKNEYKTKLVTETNWIEGKSLICTILGLDEVELEIFANTLFEEKGEALDINYERFIQDYQKHIKEKFHLSKVAKRDTSDFDFGDSFYLFPSMDYFERKKSVEYVNRLFLVYFYGYGAVNCAKLNDHSFHNPALCKLVDSNFTFITLPVDSREKLLETYKYKRFMEEVSDKSINTVGAYNTELQEKITFVNAQPYFVVLDIFGHILLEVDYEKAKDSKVFVDELKAVLRIK
jgi:hypothetical protein